jgi:hypothetical protein
MNLNKIFIYFGLVLFVLFPKIGMFDSSLFSLFLVYLLSKKNSSFDQNFILIQIILFALLILACFTVIYTQGNFDIIYIAKPVRYLIVFYFLHEIFKSNIITLDDSLNIIIVAAVINALVVVFQYFGDNIFGYKDLLDFSTNHRSTAYRKIGLASGFPSSSILIALGVVALISKSKIYTRASLYVYSIVLTLTHLIISRTGILLSAIVFVYSVFGRGGIKRMYLLFIILTLFSLLGLFFLELHYVIKTSELMFEFFITGEVTSVNSLFAKHYSSPENLDSFLIGTMHKTWSLYGSNSDVFFTKYLYSVGFLSMILYLLIFVILVVMSYKSIIVQKIDKGYKFALIAFTLIFLVTLFKGSYIFSRFSFDAFLIFIFSSIYSEKISNYKNLRQSSI